MRKIKFSCTATVLLAGLALGGTAAGQDTEAESSRHVLIGLRVRYFPIPSMSVMANRTDLATTTSPAPVRDWSFDTASQSNRFSGGPRVEILAGEVEVYRGSTVRPAEVYQVDQHRMGHRRPGNDRR